jgi:protein-tyrosine phosphatase
VLVVCYGNIYRSPFVEAYFARWPRAGLEVRSVGLHPIADRDSPPRHVAMSRAFDVELGAHHSKVLTPDDLRWAELVVLMDRHNWQALAERGADRHRLVWLGALTNGPVEIPDPYGLDDAQAERIVVRLLEGCMALAERLSRRRVSPIAD